MVPGMFGWLAKYRGKLPRFADREIMKNRLIRFQHTFSYLRHLLRGNNLETITPKPDSKKDSPPVLLIHGFLGTAGSMFVLKERLLEDGFHVFPVNLGILNVRDIRTSAFSIYRQVESILEATKQPKLDIVAHSMGGLIALYYILRLYGSHRVRRLIMLGSPVQGTWSAILGVGTLGLFCDSVWQILPGSDFLKDLLSVPLPSNVEFFTLAATHDRLCPPESTYIEGAHRSLLPFGHSSLVLSTEVYSKIRGILYKAS